MRTVARTVSAPAVRAVYMGLCRDTWICYSRRFNKRNTNNNIK